MKILKTIAAFHIGRGGRYCNPGNVSFIGLKKINEFIHDLFFGYENQREVYKLIKDRENLEAIFDRALQGDEVAYEFFAKINLPLGEACYLDHNQKWIISESDVHSGVGVIDIDGSYDTTYCKFLTECTDSEIEIITTSPNWELCCTFDEISYIKERLSIETVTN